jgi:uncharacterized membrane protein YhaH (DUF805 family)
MSILSIFSLKGRLTRLPYALIAVPILLIFAGSPFIANNLHILLQKLGVTLTLANVGIWLVSILLLIRLLIVPLMIVTIRRLHDIGLTGFLALPYLINEGLKFYVAWTRSQTLLEGATPDPAFQQALTFLSMGAYYYGLVLAFALCLIPSRKKPATFSVAAA